MTRKRKWLFAIVAIIFVLAYIGYDLSTLQVGLERPSDAVFETASSQSQVNSPPALIETYDSFSVSVEDGIAVDVHMRENATATANVFMVHGAGGGAWVWEEYFEYLPEAYNLYAISWRGHFTSSPVDDANSADYVQDQLAVIRTIETRNDLPIHVVGHSYGGATSVFATAQIVDRIASLHLVAPVVPLDYTLIQEQLIPPMMGAMMSSTQTQALATAEEVAESGQDTAGSGTFAGMFIDLQQMERYWDLYAVKPYSVEKPGLLGADGFSSEWQEQLDEAYMTIGGTNLPVWFLIAQYDNVIIPTEQEKTAEEIGAIVTVFESGHYIQLDSQAEESADFLIENLEQYHNGR
ncbi:MAG: alpha/beta hydrolase [Chloroflexota bacterium]